jgi:transposase InsO family protein
MLKLDNHPVHDAACFRFIMRCVGIRLSFTKLASPWQNGRIERLFGTVKACLRAFAIRDTRHLELSLSHFRYWYNEARPHQHLGGRTPSQVWRGLDPYRRAPTQALWFQAWDGRLRGWVLRH